MTLAATVQRSPRNAGSRRALSLLLWLAGAATVLTAVGRGWFQVYFQLFGEQADRADYTTAVGVYAVGAVLLMLTPLVAWLLGLSPASSVVAVAGAVVLALLAADAAHHAAALSPDQGYAPTWRHGVAVLTAYPWMWSLPALLLGGIAARLRIFVVSLLRHSSLREDR
jgi:hypothetical protein